jgi:GNAT superfamily N-acetyltransferase
VLTILVRKALPSDKESLMSFIKDIWGGHDYIPQVWDDWLEDQSGRMFVVEVDGVPVGMNRVRFLGDGTAWFEGARVHPKFRGKRLASMLGENSMRVAQDRGITTFRLTSGSNNRAAHRHVARMRFRERSRVSIYEPPSKRIFKPQEGVEQVEASGLAASTRMITESKEFKLGSGMYWDNLSAIGLTKETLLKLVDDGSVWTSGGAIGVSRLGGEGSERWRQVCFLGGDAEGAGRIVKHVFSFERGGKDLRRFVFLPHGSKLITALRKDGFRRDFSMVLFERRAPNG